jgi:hypothetical protein
MEVTDLRREISHKEQTISALKDALDELELLMEGPVRIMIGESLV